MLKANNRILDLLKMHIIVIKKAEYSYNNRASNDADIGIDNDLISRIKFMGHMSRSCE